MYTCLRLRIYVWMFCVDAYFVWKVLKRIHRYCSVLQYISYTQSTNELVKKYFLSDKISSITRRLRRWNFKPMFQLHLSALSGRNISRQKYWLIYIPLLNVCRYTHIGIPPCIYTDRQYLCIMYSPDGTYITKLLCCSLQTKNKLKHVQRHLL